MKTIQFQIGVTIDENAAETLAELMKRVVREVTGIDEQKEARLRASQHALFCGQNPPEHMGLLIDTKQAAKLLKVSERTLWGMWNSREMPKPIRIGRAVRWSYDELKAWVAAGCPLREKWRYAIEESGCSAPRSTH